MGCNRHLNIWEVKLCLNIHGIDQTYIVTLRHEMQFWDGIIHNIG
jgi:hypothetical protein